MKQINEIMHGKFISKRAGYSDDVDGQYLADHPWIHGYQIQIIASSGLGWEHVSITLVDCRKKSKREFVKRTPTWQEMCWIKELFWYDHEAVMQLHPPKSEWVNNHPWCLHLWRPTDREIPLPESIMVGIKDSV